MITSILPYYQIVNIKERDMDKHLKKVILYIIRYKNKHCFTPKYRSWKQEKEKNAYLIEIEEILPAYSLSCINRNRLRKE